MATLESCKVHLARLTQPQEDIIMKLKNKTLAATLIATFAFAGTAAAESAMTSQGEPTRAEVRAELDQARDQGRVTYGNLDYPPPMVQTEAPLTRAEVREELDAARTAGMLPESQLDYPVQASLDSKVDSESRQQVQAELQQAREQGLVSRGNLDYPPERTPM